jgi:hypothetical protein
MAGWRFALLALMAAAVADCAHKPGEVSVGIGTAAYTSVAANPYAVLYKPYAEMATLAYTNPPYVTGDSCPSVHKLRADPTEDNQAALKMLADLAGADWSCRSGHIGPYGCRSGTRRCLEGLEYHVWRRGHCGDAVIAFRGSDAGDIGDWLSNFRWFVGRKFFDQYDQVQEAVPDIVDELHKAGCRANVIMATGHSLGGGLAQHAAYADKRIAYVYAFDPSPVTAFFGVPFPQRSAASERLGIDRVYEAGEILSLPRYIVSGVFPSPQCRPRVRIVRFDTSATPTLIERHRMRNLATGLIELAVGATVTDKGRLGFKHARECDFVQPDKFGE